MTEHHMWKRLHPRATSDHLGLIQDFILDEDPRSAKEQLHAAYAHGGGWIPFKGFHLDMGTKDITYPGDEALPPLWYRRLRDEQIFVYPHAWVLILQPDGSYEVARMD